MCVSLLIMATIFEFNDSSLKSFSKFFGKAPKRARRVVARLLTQFAFGTREFAIKEIKKSMTIRNERFLKSRMRFERAKPINIDNQESRTFSVGATNFTGWAEQQSGSVHKRTRSQTLLARGGNFKRKVKPSVRMKPGKSFVNEGDFNLPSGKGKMPAYFRILRKPSNRNKPFIIKRKYKSLDRGLYVQKRGKLKKLQSFDAKPTKVKRNEWMTRARASYFKSINLEKEWIKAIDNVLTKKRFK